MSVLLGLCLVWTLFLGATVTALVSTSSSSGTGETDSTTALTMHPFELLVLTVFGSAWLWVPAVVLCALSPLWSRGATLRLALAVPGVALLLGLLPWTGWGLTGSVAGVEVGAWTGVAAGLALAAWLFWHDLRPASRRARALA